MKTSVKILVFLFVFNSVAFASTFIFENSNQGYDCTIFINDFPVLKNIYENDVISTSSRINEYITEGENSLKVILTPKTLDRTSFTFTLKSHDSVDSSGNLVRIELKESYSLNKKRFVLDDAVVSISNRNFVNRNEKGVLIKTIFEVKGHSLTKLPWRESLTEISSEDEKQIFTLMLQLREGYEKKDIDGISQLFGKKLQRVSLGYDRDFKKLVGSQQKFLKSIFRKECTVKKLNRNSMRLSQVGGINLAEVLFDDDFPIIVSYGERKLQVPIYVSKINDKWQVVD